MTHAGSGGTRAAQSEARQRAELILRARELADAAEALGWPDGGLTLTDARLRVRVAIDRLRAMLDEQVKP